MLVEAPTYDRPLKILARLGAEVVAVPMDDEGLVPDELPEGEFAFLYTIPTFQNPSGRTMSEARRRRLAELAAERGLLVLEDDPYGLVRYEGDPLPSVFELSGGGDRVLLVVLEDGRARAARRLVRPARGSSLPQLEALATSTYISPPYLSQATVLEFLTRGSFEPNLERVNGLLRARRDAMLAALEREMPDDATGRGPTAATSSGSSFRPAPPSGRAARAAEAAGVTLRPGQPTSTPAAAGGEQSLRLAFSFVSPDEIADGVARLARLALSYAAAGAARAARAAAAAAARGCRRETARNVGQVASPASAQRPARPK